MRQLRHFRLTEFPPATGPGDAPPPAALQWIFAVMVEHQCEENDLFMTRLSFQRDSFFGRFQPKFA